MRIRKCVSQQEMERVVDDYITQEYKVKQRGESSVLVQKKDYGSMGGHIIVALLTIWWTLGIGNLVYALVKQAQADKVMVKLDDALVQSTTQVRGVEETVKR